MVHIVKCVVRLNSSFEFENKPLLMFNFGFSIFKFFFLSYWMVRWAESGDFDYFEWNFCPDYYSPEWYFRLWLNEIFLLTSMLVVGVLQVPLYSIFMKKRLFLTEIDWCQINANCYGISRAHEAHILMSPFLKMCVIQRSVLQTTTKQIYE